jgi:hypothetical protein
VIDYIKIPQDNVTALLAFNATHENQTVFRLGLPRAVLAHRGGVVWLPFNKGVFRLWETDS